MSKIHIDLNQPLKGPDGATMPLGDGRDATGARLLSACLFNSTHGPVIKFYDYAMTLHQEEPIDVDNADFDLLYKFIESHQSIPVISKFQLMKMFMDSKQKDAS